MWTLLCLLVLVGAAVATGKQKPCTSMTTCCPKQKISYCEDWGYATVRSGAHMFWWLYEKNTTSNRPLVIWLQGGPGSSGAGFGNFEEIGPLDDNLKPRKKTWLQLADLLFIDNPVGTGFSYVDNLDKLTTNVNMISQDLIVFLKQFFTQHSELKMKPLYIFSESYGGKMATVLSWSLWKAMKAQEIEVNFQGVALGDSWISAIDYVDTWASYLYQTATNGVSWYNILKHGGEDPWSRSKSNLVWSNHFMKTVMQYDADMSDLNALMNGKIRQKLGIIPDNVTFGGQSGEVFNKQAGDFMVPVISTVDKLLMQTNLSVTIYNGQLDLICDTPGTLQWMNKLQWPDLYHFKGAQRVSFSASQISSGSGLGFVKTYGRLSLYWILKSGHMAPHDAPDAALEVLRRTIAT